MLLRQTLTLLLESIFQMIFWMDLAPGEDITTEYSSEMVQIPVTDYLTSGIICKLISIQIRARQEKQSLRRTKNLW